MPDGERAEVKGVEDSPMRDKSTDPIDEMAAWYARLTSEDVKPADRRAFAAWVKADPAHAAAYHRLMLVLGRTDAALADPAVPAGWFAPADAAAVRSTRRPAARPVHVALAAVLLLAAGVGLSLALWPRPHFVSVATGVGQMRELQLPEGSLVYMNTGTRLAYAMEGSVRRVRLEDGEAYFQVAKDPSRPFVIDVGGREVRVVGTQFNIRHLATHTDLAVAEGRVRLSQRWSVPVPFIEARMSGQLLTAGMRVSYDSSGGPAVRGEMPTSQIAPWRRGQLIYRGERLEDVIADLDRYFPGSLRVRGTDVANLRVSAVIHLGEEEKILSVLARQLPIRVTRLSGDVIEISAASP